MLVGRAVFEAESYEGWAEQHKTIDAQPPSGMRPELANWQGLDQLVLKLLAKDREQRPNDVDEFLRMLGLVRFIGPGARAIPEIDTLASSAEAEAFGESAPASEDTRKSSTRKAGQLWAIGLIGALATALIAAVALLWSSSWLRGRSGGTTVPSQSATRSDQVLNPVSPNPRAVGPKAQPSTQGGQTKLSNQHPSAADVEGQAEDLARQQRYSESFRLFDEACKGGDMKACDFLGEMYDEGHGVARNYSMAVALYNKACSTGIARGCFDLGPMYESGRGVAKDHSNALKSYEKACDGGFPDGCFDLGLTYANGTGVTKDAHRGAALISKACDGGNSDACVALGTMYIQGEGVTEDLARARTLFSKACDSGIGNGCFNLGMIYQLGGGVAEDHSKAATFYSKACDAKVAKGCDSLGVLYENGDGVARDDYHAAALFAKACDYGEGAGCTDLGLSYLNGIGVEKDAKKAQEMFGAACFAHYQRGCDELKKLQ